MREIDGSGAERRIRPPRDVHRLKPRRRLPTSGQLIAWGDLRARFGADGDTLPLDQGSPLHEASSELEARAAKFLIGIGIPEGSSLNFDVGETEGFMRIVLSGQQGAFFFETALIVTPEAERETFSIKELLRESGAIATIANPVINNAFEGASLLETVGTDEVAMRRSGLEVLANYDLAQRQPGNIESAAVMRQMRALSHVSERLEGIRVLQPLLSIEVAIEPLEGAPYLPFQDREYTLILLGGLPKNTIPLSFYLDGLQDGTEMETAEEEALSRVFQLMDMLPDLGMVVPEALSEARWTDFVHIDPTTKDVYLADLIAA